MDHTTHISAKEGMQELTMLLLYLSRFTELRRKTPGFSHGDIRRKGRCVRQILVV